MVRIPGTNVRVSKSQIGKKFSAKTGRRIGVVSGSPRRQVVKVTGSGKVTVETPEQRSSRLGVLAGEGGVGYRVTPTGRVLFSRRGFSEKVLPPKAKPQASRELERYPGYSGRLVSELYGEKKAQLAAWARSEGITKPMTLPEVARKSGIGQMEFARQATARTKVPFGGELEDLPKVETEAQQREVIAAGAERIFARRASKEDDFLTVRAEKIIPEKQPLPEPARVERTPKPDFLISDVEPIAKVQTDPFSGVQKMGFGFPTTGFMTSTPLTITQTQKDVETVVSPGTIKYAGKEYQVDSGGVQRLKDIQEGAEEAYKIQKSKIPIVGEYIVNPILRGATEQAKQTLIEKELGIITSKEATQKLKGIQDPLNIQVTRESREMGTVERIKQLDIPYVDVKLSPAAQAAVAGGALGYTGGATVAGLGTVGLVGVTGKGAAAIPATTLQLPRYVASVALGREVARETGVPALGVAAGLGIYGLTRPPDVAFTSGLKEFVSPTKASVAVGGVRGITLEEGGLPGRVPKQLVKEPPAKLPVSTSLRDIDFQKALNKLTDKGQFTFKTQARYSIGEVRPQVSGFFRGQSPLPGAGKTFWGNIGFTGKGRGLNRGSAQLQMLDPVQLIEKSVRSGVAGGKMVGAAAGGLARPVVSSAAAFASQPSVLSGAGLIATGATLSLPDTRLSRLKFDAGVPDTRQDPGQRFYTGYIQDQTQPQMVDIVKQETFQVPEREVMQDIRFQDYRPPGDTIVKSSFFDIVPFQVAAAGGVPKGLPRLNIPGGDPFGGNILGGGQAAYGLKVNPLASAEEAFFGVGRRRRKKSKRGRGKRKSKPKKSSGKKKGRKRKVKTKKVKKKKKKK